MGELGPEPVDPTEHAFCGHDFLLDLFSCLVKGDIDGNGQVDFKDFLTISANFGREDGADRSEGDLNGDSAVNFSDFLIVSQQFGQEPEFELEEPDLGGGSIFPSFP